MIEERSIPSENGLPWLSERRTFDLDRRTKRRTSRVRIRAAQWWNTACRKIVWRSWTLNTESNKFEWAILMALMIEANATGWNASRCLVNTHVAWENRESHHSQWWTDRTPIGIRRKSADCNRRSDLPTTGSNASIVPDDLIWRQLSDSRWQSNWALRRPKTRTGRISWTLQCHSYPTMIFASFQHWFIAATRSSMK